MIGKKQQTLRFLAHWWSCKLIMTETNINIHFGEVIKITLPNFIIKLLIICHRHSLLSTNMVLGSLFVT